MYIRRRPLVHRQPTNGLDVELWHATPKSKFLSHYLIGAFFIQSFHWWTHSSSKEYCVIREPLYMDQETTTMTRIGYARVCGSSTSMNFLVSLILGG